MSWKNLKTLALVILIVLNVVFGVSVSVRYATVNYYSAEEKKLTKAILAESGITLPSSILSAKKRKLSAYSRNLSADELKETIGYLYYDKLTALNENVIEKFDVTPEGKMELLYAGEMLPSEIMNSSVMSEVIRIDEYKDKYEDAANRFFNVKRIAKARANRGALKTELSLYRLMRAAESDISIAVFTQSFGGMTGSGKLYVAFREESVISCEGELALLLPDVEMKTENADLVDLLFKEKRYFDSIGGVETRKMTVSGIYYGYMQYFDGGIAYYVPVCNILYSDGTLHGYFLTNGEKIK